MGRGAAGSRLDYRIWKADGVRLLIVSHSVNPWTPHYARYFAARGDKTLVVSFSPEPIEGVDMEFIGVEPWDKHANKHLYVTRVPRLRRIIRCFRPDLVYAPFIASNGLTAVLAWKGPTVTSGRGGDVLEQERRVGWRRGMREKLIRFVCDRCVMIHTVSQEIEDELLRLGVHASKIFQIPVGIDSQRFTPAADMPRHPATRLICVRKHEGIYDNITVIEALGRLKAAGREFTGVMASTGTLWAAHKRRAEELGLLDRVRFTGEVPHERVPELLRQADIYISATLSDGTSSALLEAMSVGLLPVISRIPANTPWVEHGVTGLLFDTQRPDMLAELLDRAIEDQELQRRAFEGNRRLVCERADQNANMKRLADKLESAAMGEGGGW